MERQYYFDDDFTGAEYRAVIDLVGRKANFVGLVFSIGIGREERLAFEGRVSELGGIVIKSSEWPGTVYYGGDRKIAVFRSNGRVLDFIRTAQESVFARHPAALELLPAAERERLGGFGCWIMI